jgi:hypothetical protein
LGDSPAEQVFLFRDLCKSSLVHLPNVKEFKAKTTLHQTNEISNVKNQNIIRKKRDGVRDKGRPKC